MNGQRTGDTFIDGDSVEFTCDVKYSLIGSSIIRCLGGRWSSALPECKGMESKQPFVKYVKQPSSNNAEKALCDDPNECCKGS